MPRSGRQKSAPPKKGRADIDEDDLDEDIEEDDEEDAGASSRSRTPSRTRREKTRSRSRSRSRERSEWRSPPRRDIAPNSRARSGRSNRRQTERPAKSSRATVSDAALFNDDADMGDEEDSVATAPIRGAFGSNQTIDIKDYLRIIHIDVSQGESTLIIYGSRKIIYAALIDGGHAHYVAAILATLVAYEVKELDLILTHSDSDHIEGLTELLKSPEAKSAGIEINKVYHRGAKANESKDLRFMEAIEAYRATDCVAERGTDFYPPAAERASSAAASSSSSPAQSSTTHHVQDRFKFACLYATAEPSMRDNNDCSIMMKLSFGEFSYYTGGDQITANEESIFRQEKKSSAAAGRSGPATITAFKCSHHGSRKSTSDKFLNAIKPKVAFISAGSASFCHPDYDVLQRLHRCNTLRAVYLTNCFYNRPQVNPHYAELEVALESKYISAVIKHAGCPPADRTSLTALRAPKNRAGMLDALRALLPHHANEDDDDDDDDEDGVATTGANTVAPPAAASSTSRSSTNGFRRTVRAAATAMEIYDRHVASEDALKMHVAGGRTYLGNIELYVDKDGRYFIGFWQDEQWSVHDSAGRPVVKQPLVERPIVRPTRHPFGRYDQLTIKSGEAREERPLDRRSAAATDRVSAAHDADLADQDRIRQANRQRRTELAAKLEASTASAPTATDKGNDSDSDPPAMAD